MTRILSLIILLSSSLGCFSFMPAQADNQGESLSQEYIALANRLYPLMQQMYSQVNDIKNIENAPFLSEIYLSSQYEMLAHYYVNTGMIGSGGRQIPYASDVPEMVQTGKTMESLTQETAQLPPSSWVSSDQIKALTQMEEKINALINQLNNLAAQIWSIEPTDRVEKESIGAFTPDGALPESSTLSTSEANDSNEENFEPTPPPLETKDSKEG